MRYPSHISCLSRRAWKIICIVCLCGGLTSCHWREAKEVIATADNLDQTEHLIYDDTAALGKSIRCLDNPFGRVLMPNTLGKAYYYMGRNLDDKYGRINQAAECYIMADRLQINDPIYRGRVNSCMGYICAQNNSDSLALIFYERSSKHFEKSDNEWRFAQSLLNISRQYIELHLFDKADSILHIVQMYQLDSAYQARYLETKGLFFYEQEQYDYALTHFQDALNYWKDNETKCFCYVKIMQTYFSIDNVEQTLFYAQRVVNSSNNPNHLVNAYYCLLQDAKNRNNAQLLSYYSHARTDAQKALRNGMLEDTKALPILAEYLNNPHPLRWIRITLFLSIILCAILAISIAVYRKLTTAKIHLSTAQINSLSLQIKKHEEELNKHLEMHLYDKHLDKLRRKYPKPLNKWNDYNILKNDIDPYLHNWLEALEKLDLTNRENVFCTLSFIYPHLPIDDLANYMCITKDAFMVRKARIVKKLEITSTQFVGFLQSL